MYFRNVFLAATLFSIANTGSSKFQLSVISAIQKDLEPSRLSTPLYQLMFPLQPMFSMYP